MLIKYIGKRLILVVPVILSITVITFVLTSFSAGDTARILAEKVYNFPTMEQIEEIRHEEGLDQPLHIQYGRWLKKVVKGDFGKSIDTGRPAIEELMTHFKPTLKLGLMGFILLILVSVPLGVFSVVYENRLIDKIVKLFSYISVSMPNFWLGLLCLYVFGVKLGIISVIGSDTEGVTIIAAFVLDFGFFGVLIRLIRANLIDVMNKDFIRACRAKGLGTTRILFVHGLKNALIPVITRSTTIILHLVTGSAVVETIFSIKGVGYLALNAVSLKDLPVIQCYIIVASLIVIFINLAIDISYSALDKRIKLQ